MVLILMAIHLVIRLGINGYGLTVSQLLPFVRFGQLLRYAHKRIVNILRRRGSAIECWTLERESPGSNPLHMMAPLMATRCGDNKTKSL